MKISAGSSFDTYNIRQRRPYNTTSPDSRGMRATNNVISQTEISQEATSFRTADSPDSDRGECVYLTSQSILGLFLDCFRSLRVSESENDDNVRFRLYDSEDSEDSRAFSRSLDNYDDLIQRKINKTKMFGEGTNCNTVFRNWLVDVDHAYNEDQVVNFLAELYNDEFGQMTIIKQELIQQGHIHSVFAIMCDRLRTHSFDVENF